MLMPRQAVPQIALDTVAHGRFDLATEKAERFTMLVFYRGLHCPICAKYLLELERLMPEFEQRGVSVVAISSDGAERAAAMADKVKAHRLRFACGLPLEQARAWGLYISTSRGKTSIGIDEPAEFNEPGMFIVRPDNTLYWSQISTMPFARPHFSEILGGLKFALEKDYPARGELS